MCRHPVLFRPNPFEKNLKCRTVRILTWHLRYLRHQSRRPRQMVSQPLVHLAAMFLECVVSSGSMCPEAFIPGLTRLINDSLWAAWEQQGASRAHHAQRNRRRLGSLFDFSLAALLLSISSPISVYFPHHSLFSPYIQYSCLIPIVTQFYFITFFPL